MCQKYQILHSGFEWGKYIDFNSLMYNFSSHSLQVSWFCSHCSLLIIWEMSWVEVGGLSASTMAYNENQHVQNPEILWYTH